MSKPIKSFSELVQNFFCQRLQIQQRVSGHTLASYRDTFRLGLEFIHRKTGRAASDQKLEDWDAPNVLAFLDSLEKQRGCQPRTRNARLAAIRAFMHYAGQQEPAALALSSRVLAIPMKRFDRPLLGFLSPPEINAILDATNPNTPSQALEERQQSVPWLEEPGRLSTLGGFGQDFLLQCQICVEIDLGGLDGLMPQPQSDDRPINACLQKRHCKCMAQYMGRDPFLFE